MRIQNKYGIIIISISFCIILFTKCIDNKKSIINKIEDNRFLQFAGSQKCINCHKNIYDNHIKTAHFLTSSIATQKNILGSFNKPTNSFHFANNTVIVCEKRDSISYQVGYYNNNELKRQSIDIIFGSGTKGQTFASWKNDNLVQLPLTYFTDANQWANSPGYPNRMAFNRPITSRCLECHATYASKNSADSIEPESFDKNRLILGIDCEKCHGPAQQHVIYQTTHPIERVAKFIINPKTFSRQQSLDMCTLCHGGRLQKTKPSFSFTAGDKLSDFFLIDTITKDVNTIDVHGNQAGLLSASKCFKMSNMSCITCHNTHENEKGKTALFSQKCITCHNNEAKNVINCKLTDRIGKSIINNCIDCHMPLQPSKSIAVLLQGNATTTSALMRNHDIKIYKEPPSYINKKNRGL